MKAKLTTVLCLLLTLAVHSQTWKVLGIDTLSMECKIYSNITIFNDILWTGLSEFDNTTFVTVETPSMLFACDFSKSDHKGNIWFVGSIRPDVWTTHGNAYTVYKFDGSEWSDYSPPKSFGYNGCSSITFQNDSNIWFTTSDNGAFMYDGSTWHHYFEESVFDGANSLAFDNYGNKWFATYRGLIKFDGSNWTAFNDANSGLKFNAVNDIAIDKNDNIWLATGSTEYPGDTITGRIVKFDGTNWTYYKTFDDSQGLNYVNTIAIDSDGKIWAGTFLGIAVFDGLNWTKYSEPYIPANNVQVLSIDFDSFGNKWFGTTCGIWKFQDNAEYINYFPSTDKIHIFPNPANSYVNIYLSGQMRNGKISILNSNGSSVLRTNISGDNVQLDISNLKQGVHFIYIKNGRYSIVKKLIKE
jgi:hypothetical protein